MIGDAFYLFIFECAVCISHSVFDCVQCVVCRVCVHWGRVMLVEQILKMESFFVGAALPLDSRGSCGNTPCLPWSLFPPWVAYPSHLGNKQVKHCGATVHRDCSSLPCHLIFLLVMCLTKCTTVFTHWLFFLFFFSVFSLLDMYLIHCLFTSWELAVFY